MKYAILAALIWIFGALKAHACDVQIVQDCSTCPARTVTVCRPMDMNAAPRPPSSLEQFNSGMRQFNNGMEDAANAGGFKRR